MINGPMIESYFWFDRLLSGLQGMWSSMKVPLTINDVNEICLEMFYLNSTLNYGIPPVLVFQLEVYFKADRILTGLIAQQKGTTARWYSNKASLLI